MKKITQNTIDSMISFLRDESKKAGFSKVVLGLSGGIDSAVVALLCKLAFCKETRHAEPLGQASNLQGDKNTESKNLKTLIMPSLASSKESLKHALELCDKFQIEYEIADIKEYDRIYCAKNPHHTALERGNFCARLRMATLYDISARENRLVIGTSNKSELLLGYGTLFGDLACALNPIGSLFKTQIFELAKLLNVPDSIISKAPSADLYAGQSDESELGYSYSQIDEFLESYEQNLAWWNKFIKNRELEVHTKRHLSHEDFINLLKKEFGISKLNANNKKDLILKHKLKTKFPVNMVESLYSRIKANSFKANPTKILKI